MAAGEDVNQFAALLGAYPFQREVLDQVVSFVHGHPSVGSELVVGQTFDR